MFSRIIISVILLFIHQSARPQGKAVERPRLVIGLSVDQLRWDYLYRYHDRMGKGGIRRLMNQGFNFDNMFINYVPSVTAVGHASLFTGTVPALHGIVGNEWVENGSGSYTTSVRDKDLRSLGKVQAKGQAGPRNLLSSTIGDELRLATNFRSRVFSVSYKDRSSILPGGRGANAAYWFDDSIGCWISSSYYMNRLPDWVNEFNGRGLADAYSIKQWTPLYDTMTYMQSTADYVSWEKNLPNEKESAFPHHYDRTPGANYAALGYSPWGNSMTVDFAMSLMLSEGVGMNGNTDMLCLSLSSLDIVGHQVGPNSMENEDMFLRLDKDIERLLGFLDKNIGKENYLLFLSSDHGVNHTPAFLQSKNMAGGSLRLRPLYKELNDSCRSRFGFDPVVGIYAFQVYLNHRRIDSAGLRKGEVEDYVMELLKKKDEVMNVFSYSEFDKWVMPERVKQMFANGYYNRRSGDIQIILKPQYSDRENAGADHATWYNYDTKLPLIFFGWKVPKGTSYREVYITDVAPTVAAMLRIQPPNASIGKVLGEVVGKVP
jgi:predicted AlkP superfamily pyrophosphatase or phosphodiesterase